MIKYYCDKCGKEIKPQDLPPPQYIWDRNSARNIAFVDDSKHLCPNDYKRYEEFLKLLNNKKDQAIKGWWENGNNSEI